MSGTQHGTSETTALDRAGFYLLTFCVVLAPIPFGSSNGMSTALIAVLLALCLLGSVFLVMPNDRAQRLFRATMLLSGVVVLWSLAQASPWHSSSAAHPISSEAARFIEDVPSPVSVLGYQILQSTGYVLIPLIGFMCALVYIRDDGRYTSFVQTVLGLNLAITVFCLGQYIVSPRSLLWADKLHYLDAFTGTFVNPNTAATHFGFLLMLALSSTLRLLERANPYRLIFVQDRLSARDHGIVRMLTVYAIATFVFMIALLLTKSRAGIISTLVGVVGFVASFSYFALRRRASLARAMGISALSVLAVAAVSAFFGQRLLLRLQDEGLVEAGRLCTYESTWNAIKEGSWWGSGLGTFQDLFPSYRLPACGLYGHWEMAHSVFLEGWLALGIVFLPCVVVVYFQLIRTYARGVLARRRFRHVPLCCLCLLLVLTLHSLVDFSLQVPGFSLVAAAILGAGATVALGRDQGGRQDTAVA